MKFQKQLYRHNPDAGVYGDCCRTVLACFLDLDPLQVPHFGELYWGRDAEWGVAQTAFLAAHGVREVSVAYQGGAEDALEKVQQCAAAWSPGVYYMLCGASRNGTNHVVICLDGRIVWDPALDESGIVGPGTDGYYWLHYLTADRFASTMVPA